MKKQLPKVLFGFIIFLFSVTLAYFTASYLNSNQIFDYCGTIAIFAGTYVVAGISIAMIFPVSLGLLFSADMLIINLLYQNYGHWGEIIKTITTGSILIILYVSAYLFLKDKPTSLVTQLSVAKVAGEQFPTQTQSIPRPQPEPQLLDYIKSELRAGVSKNDIKNNLLANNWRETDVDAAFNSLISK